MTTLNLTVCPPNGPPTHVSFSKGYIRIGKMNTSDIRLSDYEKAARMHAVIENFGSESFQLVDLGSSYGTYLNKARMGDVAIPLESGDIITIGNTKIIVE